MNPLDLALQQLQKQFSTPEDALFALEVLEKKRKDEHFVKYWTPTDKQLANLKRFTPDIKTFGLLGGNRSGKTELGAAICVAWALGKDYFKGEPAWEWVKDLPIPDKAANIWVVGLDFPTLRDVIWREKLRYGRNHPGLVPMDALRKPPNDSDFQIFFENGSVITGKSADSGREKFQGASVDLIWIDEECEADVYDECYQRTVDCGGRILLTLTPLTDINSGVRTPWVFDLYEDAKKGQKDVAFVQLSVLDNPYVPEDEKKKLLEKWAGHPEERARLYGDFVQRSGLIYHMWNPAKHMVKPFQVPLDWPCIVSIDPAATGITAAVWVRVDPVGNLYLTKEYYEKEKIVSDHAKDILVRNAGQKVDIWLIDPTWGRQRNAETHKQNMQLYRENGVPVRLAEVGEDFGLNVSLEYMNATINPTSRHPKVYVFEGLANFRFEVEHYVWAMYGKGENQGQSKEKPLKRHDHLLNATQYAMAMRPKGRNSNKPSPQQLQTYAANNSYT